MEFSVLKLSSCHVVVSPVCPLDVLVWQTDCSADSCYEDSSVQKLTLDACFSLPCTQT